MFSIFLLKQVHSFLADGNTCVILCEFLNKVCIIFKLLLGIPVDRVPTSK